MTRLQSYHLESSAVGQRSKSHIRPNKGRRFCARGNFVPLVVPGLSSNSGTSLSSTSPPQDSSRTSSSPATERSGEPAPGNWRDSPKTQNKTKRDNNRASRDRLRDLAEWLEEFTEKSRRYRSACARAHVVTNQIRNVLQKWHSRKHSIFLTSRKIEIARHACEPG